MVSKTSTTTLRSANFGGVSFFGFALSSRPKSPFNAQLVFVAYIYIYIRRKHRLHIELRFGCDDEAEPTKLTPQVLAPLVEAFPDRIPSIYEVADILGELDRLCGGSLLKAGGSAEVLASKSIDLAKKLKILLQTTRRLARRSTCSRNQRLQILKSLMVLPEKELCKHSLPLGQCTKPTRGPGEVASLGSHGPFAKSPWAISPGQLLRPEWDCLFVQWPAVCLRQEAASDAGDSQPVEDRQLRSELVPGMFANVVADDMKVGRITFRVRSAVQSGSGGRSSAHTYPGSPCSDPGESEHADQSPGREREI